MGEDAFVADAASAAASDPVSGRWMVSPGFENHPAYRVTWIGAATAPACRSWPR
ncbi:hypothetical protein ACWDRB_54850 [Nonomuraea sp. NPDC003707]